MNKVAIVLSFIFGGAIGSVVTWKFLDRKYSTLSQVEIDSVKEAFARQKKSREEKSEESTVITKEEIDEPEKPKEETYSDIKEYASKLYGADRINYSDISNVKVEEPKEEKKDRPYVIAPEEFGDIEEYDKISLTYYSDGVLVDDGDEIIFDVDNVVGKDSLTHFGEYEEDSVFVRNDKRKTDYEILLDNREYSSIFDYKPYKNRDRDN